MADYKKPKFDNGATKHQWVGEYDMAKAKMAGQIAAKVTGVKQIEGTTNRIANSAYRAQVKLYRQNPRKFR